MHTRSRYVRTDNVARRVSTRWRYFTGTVQEPIGITVRKQAPPAQAYLHKSRENSVKRLAKRFGCPVELSLELLGGKWKPVILARLKERPHRYSELRKLIPTLSTKMLTERLRDLEVQGLVERRGIAGKPHAVYRLTARAE